MRKNLLLLLCGLPILCFGQSAQVTTALEHFQQEMSEVMSEDDAPVDLRVTDMYTSKHNGVTHIYFTQQYNGVDVNGATYNANILHDEVLISFENVIPDVAERIVSTTPSVSPTDAIGSVLKDFQIESREPLSIKEYGSANHQVYNRGSVSHLDMPVNLQYVADNTGNYRLVWEVEIEPVTHTDIFKVHVDATTGAVVDRISLTRHCSFPNNWLAHNDQCTDESHNHVISPSPLQSDGATYKVFPIPFESPNHVEPRFANDPSDADASPFGWHDRNGEEGADVTWTQGNNVYAFLDRDGDYTFNEEVVDGGEDLIFDFPYDADGEPQDNIGISVTNLFYMNNVMHDMTYHYGFDELSGNFQEVNYTGVGADNDYVLAHSQFSAGSANPSLNNATFGTPSDGGSGRMRMFVWNSAGANQLLRVDAPGAAAGTYNTSTTTDWGVAITSEPLTGEVVIVEDASGQPTLGCNDLINGDDVDGKIALIDRGNCEFGRKALRAQEAGAIGFIICNFEEGLVNMGGGLDGGQVTIPGVFIANSDCQKIRAFAGDGLVVSFVNQSDESGPSQLAGSFDNGIIAHEYGHGISNRLTGGPSRAGCLVNYDQDNDPDGTREEGEQMGEGWSDFFSLVTTVKPTDVGSRGRGIGTYAQGQDTAGIGIRPFAYSTDMAINPLTYDDVAFYSVPHGVGTVWCTMLWDLYWAFVDEYGFDEDLYTGKGGNNLAIQLVMDGMKMQPCNPGFVTGRDAILASDIALTGGENQKLIWEVFARRGLGVSADQGSNAFRVDGTEAFDVEPSVIKTVKVYKEMTPFVEAGDEIDVTLVIRNDKDDDATGVVVTDLIPEGAEFIDGSSSVSADVDGNTITFSFETLTAGSIQTISYRLLSAANLPSTEIFFDDMEQGDLNWDLILDEGSEFWQLQTLSAFSGETAWGVANSDEASDVSLINLDPITIDVNDPVLRFYHNVNTEKFFDSGILQISNDNGFTWNAVTEDLILRGKYTSKIPFTTFAIPRMRGWNGNSNGFFATVVDLSDYAGESVKFRWRFGSDSEVSFTGWFIDDVEVLDAYFYNSEVCLTSVEGDDVCAIADGRGTMVESGVTTSTRDNIAATSAVKVYPNPASGMITIESEGGYDDFRLLNATGQEIWAGQFPAQGPLRESVSTESLPRGFYYLHGSGPSGQTIKKIVLQ